MQSICEYASQKACSDQVFTSGNWYGVSLRSGWTHLRSFATINSTHFHSLDLKQRLESHIKPSGTNKPCTVERTDIALLARSKQNSFGDTTSKPAVVAASLLPIKLRHTFAFGKKAIYYGQIPSHSISFVALIISCAEAWKKPMQPIIKSSSNTNTARTRTKKLQIFAYYISCFIFFGYFHCVIQIKPN